MDNPLEALREMKLQDLYTKLQLTDNEFDDCLTTMGLLHGTHKVLVPINNVNSVHYAPAVPAQKVAQGGSLQSYLQANQDQHKQILHFIKAYASKDHVERWFNLSRSDRECISNTSRNLGKLWIAGSDYVNSQDDWITHLKLACPDASAEIDEWHQECLARRQAASANWTANYNKLPQTVQTFLTNLNETFDSLRRTGVLVRLARLTRNDTTEIQDALLPVVKEFLAVPQGDWDKVAEVFPRTENILGSNGNLTTHIFVLVRALDEHLTNGTVPVTNLGAIIQAQEACKKNIEETFIQYALAWKQQVESASEQEFSPHAESELESSVHSSLAAAAENVPSS
uniref:Uncharacterized protein n=1 Tax=Acrobeloides nanus TaxID=290746 RepID=A0A914DLD5_9BILA